MLLLLCCLLLDGIIDWCPWFRFDKEQKYDPIKVEEDRDDALIKLQNIERSLLELSQQTLQPQVGAVGDDRFTGFLMSSFIALSAKKKTS